MINCVCNHSTELVKFVVRASVENIALIFPDDVTAQYVIELTQICCFLVLVDYQGVYC